jgi:tetratricopeptide (TPR) repeat protein
LNDLCESHFSSEVHRSLFNIHRFSFKSVYFIDATNTSTIHSSFRSLGFHEAKLANDLNGQDMIDGVHSWLEERDDPVLIIFDNADDRSINLGPFIPQCDGGRVIITTRNEAHRVHAHPADCHSRIGELLPDEAISLLHQHIPPDKRNYPDAQTISEQIVHELGYLPLAIAHAGSYIAASSTYVYATYIQTLNTKRLELLSQRPEQTRDKYELAVYVTWELSFENLKADLSDKASVAASEFFQLCAFLYPKDISPAIFRRAFERSLPSSPAYWFLAKLSTTSGEWDGNLFHTIINRLTSYSFITVVTESQYQIHSLVQSWSKDRLPVDSRSFYQKAILQILGDSSSLDNSTEEITNRRVLVPHLLHIGTSLLAQGDTAQNFIRAFYEAGHWSVTEELMVKMTERLILELGGDHPDTLTSMSNLALTYTNQGRWTEAEEIQVKVMEQHIAKLGNDHPDTLTSMNNLGSIYMNQGRWTEAEEIQVKVMEQHIAKLGNDHPDTLTSMNNLASTYRNQGQCTKAEEIQLKVVELISAKLGNNHPDTLTSMNNLGSIYMNQGRWTEAEEIQLKVMERRIAKLGETHPETLGGMANLAATYWNQGRLSEAEELEMKVMERRIEKLGEAHPHTLLSMSHLAATYRSQGRFAEADTLENRVKALKERR